MLLGIVALHLARSLARLCKVAFYRCSIHKSANVYEGHASKDLETTMKQRCHLPFKANKNNEETAADTCVGDRRRIRDRILPWPSNRQLSLNNRNLPSNGRVDGTNIY